MVASLIPIFLWMVFYENIDRVIDGIGWPFVNFEQLIYDIFGHLLPQFAFDRFWFLICLVPMTLICYGFFLGFLVAMFKLSRRGIPFLEDGYYPMDTEQWLLYEYYEIYYIMLPYFAWFFSVFLDTKPRHTLFGAKIGKNTVVGSGRLFNPERTEIGDDCFFGYDAIISGHVYEGDRLYLQKVKIGNNVTVGANAVILAGAVIGDNVIVGANSVVPKNREIPSDTIWVHGKAIPRRSRTIQPTDTGVIKEPSAMEEQQELIDEDLAEIDAEEI